MSMEVYAYGKPILDLVIAISILAGIVFLYLRSKNKFSALMLVSSLSYIFILLTAPAIYFIFENQKTASMLSFYYEEIVPIFLNTLTAICFLITTQRLRKI